MAYQYFADEYPAAIEHAQKKVESARMDAVKNQSMMPAYEAAKQRLAQLKYEYFMRADREE